MKWKYLLGLVLAFVVYLILGSVIFTSLEYNEERSGVKNALRTITRYFLRTKVPVAADFCFFAKNPCGWRAPLLTSAGRNGNENDDDDEWRRRIQRSPPSSGIAFRFAFPVRPKKFQFDVTSGNQKEENKAAERRAPDEIGNNATDDDVALQRSNGTDGERNVTYLIEASTDCASHWILLFSSSSSSSSIVVSWRHFEEFHYRRRLEGAVNVTDAARSLDDSRTFSCLRIVVAAADAGDVSGGSGGSGAQNKSFDAFVINDQVWIEFDDRMLDYLPSTKPPNASSSSSSSSSSNFTDDNDVPPSSRASPSPRPLSPTPSLRRRRRSDDSDADDAATDAAGDADDAAAAVDDADDARIDTISGLRFDISDDHPAVRNLREILENVCSPFGLRLVCNETFRETNRSHWNFVGSLYFATTIVTTIGYGATAPSSPWSRVVTMIYALLGIPICGFLLAGIGLKLGKARNKIGALLDKALNFSFGCEQLSWLKNILYGFILASLGFCLIILLPAYAFTYFEHWDLLTALYYATITLTTVGFGDFVAGLHNPEMAKVDQIFYISGIIAWILIGLSFLALVIDAITELMRRQVKRRMEEMAAMLEQSKLMNDRLMSGLTDGVGQMGGAFSKGGQMFTSNIKGLGMGFPKKSRRGKKGNALSPKLDNRNLADADEDDDEDEDETSQSDLTMRPEDDVAATPPSAPKAPPQQQRHDRSADEGSNNLNLTTASMLEKQMNITPDEILDSVTPSAVMPADFSQENIFVYKYPAKGDRGDQRRPFLPDLERGEKPREEDEREDEREDGDKLESGDASDPQMPKPRSYEILSDLQAFHPEELSQEDPRLPVVDSL